MSKASGRVNECTGQVSRGHEPRLIRIRPDLATIGFQFSTALTCQNRAITLNIVVSVQTVIA